MLSFSGQQAEAQNAGYYSLERAVELVVLFHLYLKNIKLNSLIFDLTS